MHAEAHTQTQLGVYSKTRKLSDNIISVSVSVCITSPFFSILPLSPAPPLSFLSVSLDGNRGGNRWKSTRREETSYIPSVMSQKQINVPGWRYALLLCDNGGNVDNSLRRHEVNLSLGPGCTVSLLSVHPTTVKQRLHRQSVAVCFCRPEIS